MADALPLNIPKRCLSLHEAAEYCGVSRNTLVRHGPSPIKIGDRNVYDRKGLDRWLDQLGGHCTTALNDSPETTLIEAIHARKTALRHPAR
jgi:predicted DNA-binding transcriptional regulator AlpA